MSGKSRSRPIGAILTAASLIAIGLVTLLPNRNPAMHQSCCVTPDYVLNVMLFIPLGIGLSLLGFSGLGAVVAGVSLSAGIELAQISLIPGRDSSFHDVVTNGLGTAAGALMAGYWGIRRGWWRWVGGALTALFLVSALTGPWLVTPVYPLRRAWYSQWQHDFRGMPAFSGRILSFAIQDIDLPDGSVAYSRDLRANLIASDTVRAALRFESGPPVAVKVQLAGLVAGWPGPWLLNFMQEQTDVLIAARFRMSDLGFSSPVFRLINRLPTTRGDTVGIVTTLARKSLRITIQDSAVSESVFPLTTELAWAAFLPVREVSPSTEPWVRGAAAFLALFVLGIGAGSNRWILGIGVLCWLGGGPLLFGLSFAGPLVVILGTGGLVWGIKAHGVLGLT